MTFDLFDDEPAKQQPQRRIEIKHANLSNVDGSKTDDAYKTIESRRKRWMLNREGQREKAWIFANVFNKQECIHIQQAVNQTLHLLGGQWKKQRHTSFPTTDLPVKELMEGPIKRMLLDRIALYLNKFAVILGFNQHDFGLLDLFFVHYSSHGQTNLEPHTDGCLVSFNIQLNDPHDFIGGGTRFTLEDKTVKLKRGEALLHDSKALHEGVKIVQGNRLVLVGFIESRRHHHQKDLFIDKLCL